MIGGALALVLGLWGTAPAVASPILDPAAHVWVCPIEEPFCFGVPVTLLLPVSVAPPVTLAPPVTVAPPVTRGLPVSVVTGGGGDAGDPVAATPEPSTLLLVGITLVGMGWLARRR